MNTLNIITLVAEPIKNIKNPEELIRQLLTCLRRYKSFTDKNSNLLGVFLLMVMHAQSTYGQEISPTKEKALIKVCTTDFNDSPRKKEIILFVNQDTKEVFEGITDDMGKCDILLLKGQVYQIKYKTFEEEVDYDKLEIPATDKLIGFALKLKYQPAKVFTLKNVLFDTDKATLKRESFSALNELAELLILKNTVVIEIGGHTDSIGTHTANLKLSEARASSVRDYLIKKGISPERLTAKGYGDSVPVSYNSTPEGRKLNRRTEVKIMRD